MYQMKYKACFLLYVVMTGLIACVSQDTRQTPALEQIIPSKTPLADACLPPIETFIYSSKPDNNKPVPGETLMVLPQPPWELVVELPPSKVLGAPLITSRSINGNVELWVVQPTGEGFKTEFLVFQTDIKEWKTVSSKIEGSQISVGKLFTTSDGSFWGAADFFSNGSSSGLGQDVSALSKYNDTKEKFEFVSSAAAISAARKDTDILIPYWSIVLKDTNDIFWVFVHNDGIYSFDPKTNLVSKQADLQDKEIYDAVISPFGELYYVLDVDTYGKMSIGQTPLFRFDPNTGKSEYLPIEFEPWPLYGDPFVDLQGRLWLGNLGFLDRDQKWYLLEKSSVFLTNKTEQSVDTRWKVATPLLESSDGRLWFRSSNGTVWLDLENQQWCWFTTYQSNIVEDSNHNLWMIADGKLYKLRLGT